MIAAGMAASMVMTASLPALAESITEEGYESQETVNSDSVSEIVQTDAGESVETEAQTESMITLILIL